MKVKEYISLLGTGIHGIRMKLWFEKDEKRQDIRYKMFLSFEQSNKEDLF